MSESYRVRAYFLNEFRILLVLRFSYGVTEVFAVLVTAYAS